MATTAFICDVEDSEGSAASLQLKQRGCSYTLLQVLVGVLAVLMLAMTGCIIWMKMSQNCPERDWMLRFTIGENYTETNFASPRSEKYEINGKISIKKNPSVPDSCPRTFRLLQELTNGTELLITRQNIKEMVIQTVKLEKGSRLKIDLNCDNFEFDEAKSILNVYQKTC
ncbi:hypothetical protein R3I94_015282 [Phoxinus phoxinus]|uniref:Uncharacterized protein n=1 Tax=Phoxinus phoxinus TaxID=58324 RepID=A0AAN9CX64_9TELE